MKTGVELIADERQRQMEKEGWSADHDKQHKFKELAKAGAIYAFDYCQPVNSKQIATLWPWDMKWWKPTPDDPVRQLVKAGALIAADKEALQTHGQKIGPKQS